ncbi:SusC/RagA family TonB-linked outer membrane protein [Chitinophaga nivalis]|uniref:TonB-dependent receptor n=1 Tax=Chitinophaga nivalis TaxID=2991709 RepID=A0ABT3ILU6_9BACT|nr:TonB-dependent receptor [Chitinophaga nivalis]MCW3465368.1 TonB-dependent receptor [Chitinophaga nivalis]MCW3484940.1 TonB-dependent receptor [Chitinophaga nivalis]
MLQRLLFFLLLLGPVAAFAQTRTVTGTILSAKDNEPLPGASIAIKGTSKGVVSGANGTFKLEVTDAAATTLVIRFIGMVEQEVPISTAPLRILLQSSGKDIDEVIVVAYGTAKKNSYTGSVSQIKGAEVASRQVSSVSKALQGLAPGVQSTAASGQPGADATIRIRGVGSVNASSDPLYVVDGAPYGGSISAINPGDIESISVLKDAASSALYGSRGANGVIIITTKRGKKQGSNIDIRVNQGFSKRAVKDYEQVNTDQYFETYWRALYNTKLVNPPKGMPANEIDGWARSQASSGVVRDLGINPYGDAYAQPVGTDGKLVPGARALWDDNWGDALQRTGTRTQADLSISGATEKTRYFVSGGYLNDQGIYLGSGFKRYNVRSNVEIDAKKWLKVGLNFNGSHSDQQAPPSEDSRTDNYVNYARSIPSFYPIYKRDGAGNYLQDNKGDRIFDYGLYRPSGAITNTNLVQTSGIDKHNVLRDNLSVRTYGEATIWRGLKFKTSYSADYLARNSHDYTNSAVGFDVETGGSVDRGSYRTFSWTFNNILTYEETFNEKHHLNLLAGQEAYKYKYSFIQGSKTGMSSPSLDEPSAATLIKGFEGYTDTYSLSSYLGRAEYDYDGKYFLSASLRGDGSSRFAPGHNWGTFWSVGGSWKASQEDFLKKASWLDLLTLRASYGGQGNDNLGASAYYSYLPLYLVANNLGDRGAYRDMINNERLQWETNLNFNVGLDFAVLKNRLGGTVEFFQRKSKNLLFSQPKAPSIGYSAIDDNIGTMKNTGVEISLHGVPVQTKDFSWIVDANLTHYKNTITALPQKEIISGTKKLMVGKSIYDFWLRDYAGVNPDNGEPLWYTNDKDGNKITTNNYANASQYYVGSAIPDVYGGLTNTFNYKGFSFSFLIVYSLGGKVLDNDYVGLVHTGSNPGRSWSKDILNAWTPENRYTDVPALTTGTSRATSSSTRFLYDASYARLKSLNLSYNLPKSLLDRAHLNNVTVYVQGENLFTLYNHQGMDPEQAVAGTTYYRYPAIKSLSAGINLSF